MAAVLRILLSLLAIAVAPFASIYSQLIVAGRDFSQADTVGVISHRGFPIPFRDVAPGYSVADGFDFTRYDMNTALWAALLVTAIQLAWLAYRRRGATSAATAA